MRFILILATVGVLLILSGFSYALTVAFFDGTLESSITADGIAFKYEEGSKKINLPDNVIMSDQEGKTQDEYFEFYISAKTSRDLEIPYYVTARKSSDSSDIDEIVNLYLTKVDEDGFEEEVAFTTYDNISQYENDYINLSKYTEKLLYTDVAKANSKYKETYRLRMWIDENSDLSDEKYAGATFGLSINVYSNGKVSLKTKDEIEDLAISKINSIRNTKNTDISKRTGNIYYVSSIDGNDSNDGLSEATAVKSLSAASKLITGSGDTVLFKRGGTYSGQMTISKSDVLIGSYGDTSLPKPVIDGSYYDGAKNGSWTEVKPNIWKYSMGGKAALYKDVGEIWFFCNEGNDNCQDYMPALGKSVAYSKKITTDLDYDESNLDETIDQLLKNDLEFYHAGHKTASSTDDAGYLYVYSTSNPKTRFNEIKFNLYKYFITTTYWNLAVDNLDIKYYSNYAISTSLTPDFTLTNCEIGFIGGGVKEYNSNNKAVRGGFGVKVGGPIRSVGSYDFKTGLVARNNYIYQIYDEGIGFQTIEADYAPITSAKINDNVIEYCGNNIYYYMATTNTNGYKLTRTNIKNFSIKNNIIRYAGSGFASTRDDYTSGALIATKDDVSGSMLNYVRYDGKFSIENNILESSSRIGNNDTADMLHIASVEPGSLPTIKNNRFYSYSDTNLGYYYSLNGAKNLIPYSADLAKMDKLSNNTYVLLNQTNINANNDSGTTGDVSYSFDASKKKLTISGSGRMADYTLDSLAPWMQYSNQIETIEIGENVTYLGKYAFYDLKNVKQINFNAKSCVALSSYNYTFYQVGRNVINTTLTIGANVTKIPNFLTNSTNNIDTAPNITKIIFKGNKVTSIGVYAFSLIFIDDIAIPESVTTIGHHAFYNDIALKTLILPDGLTTVSEALAKHSTSLELVVLGSSTNTIATDAFTGCKDLTELVIPNENIELDSSLVIFDEYSPVGLDVYGNSSVEAFVNQKNEAAGVSGKPTNAQQMNNGTKYIYYYALNNYRPIIHGDGKTYNAEFNEINYGDTANFSLYALNNSNVTVNGADYYYLDNYGRKHIVDSPISVSNNTISNVRYDIQVDATLTKTSSCTTDAQEVLFIGNSISTAWKTHGMASTNEQSDYIYYVMQYMKSLNKNTTYQRYKINPYEQTDTTLEQRKAIIEDIITTFDTNKQHKVGTIFLQFGDNLGNEASRTTFVEATTHMINRLREAFPGAKLYYVYGRYALTYMNTLLPQIIDNTGIEWIDVRYLGDTTTTRYQSYYGAKYLYYDDSFRRVAAEDVDGHVGGGSSHPGDYGFTCMGDSVINYLKEHNYCD